MEKENKVIAMLLEKIALTDNRFLFRPVEVIEGFLDEDEEFLTTKHNKEYFNMQSSVFAFSESKECFGFDMPLFELLNKYGYEAEKEAIEAYFDDVYSSVHIGTYSDETDLIEVTDIPFEDIDSYGSIDILEGVKKIFIQLTKEEIDVVLEEKDIKKIHDKFAYYKQFLEAVEEKIKNEMPDLDLLPMVNPEENQKYLPDVKVKEATVVKPVQANIDVEDLYKKVTAVVKSQDSQVEDIVTTVAMNYIANNKHSKSHILITGPTGTGKTAIMGCISEYLNIPIAEYDMTQISVAGYVGKNVDDALIRLYNNANRNLERAQRGILALDEIDKKASDRNDDVSGRGVLNSLLKILDGTVFDLEIERGIKVPFDTSNITVVAMGAFANMKKDKRRPVGFCSKEEAAEASEYGFDDYVKFGIPGEFMGRFTTLVTLNDLSLEDLESILLTSKLSPLLMKKEILKDDFDVNLNYTDAYVEAVARRAIALKTGARSLKRTVYESLKKAENRIMRERIYKELILDEKTVSDNKAYVLK
jgi:ATP-dependent Clp protease ATP-binding subunit ClpX